MGFGYPNQQSPYLIALPSGAFLSLNTITMSRTISVQEFMKELGFVSIIPQIRRNANTYPFITFMSANNVAENIYFSVNAAAALSPDAIVNREFLENHTITMYMVDDEPRYRLSGKGSSLRLSYDDIFG
jgi:hypothetical protein